MRKTPEPLFPEQSLKLFSLTAGTQEWWCRTALEDAHNSFVELVKLNHTRHCTTFLSVRETER